jgi:hypothetical protein
MSTNAPVEHTTVTVAPNAWPPGVVVQKADCGSVGEGLLPDCKVTVTLNCPLTCAAAKGAASKPNTTVSTQRTMEPG